MDRILIVVSQINGGGVATAVNNFFLVCSNYSDKVKFDVLCFHSVSDKVRSEYSKYGANIYVAPRFKKNGLVGYYRAISRCMEQNGPYKAIHAHTAYFIWLAAKAAKKAGIPIRVGHAHGRKSALPWFIRFWFLPISRWLNRKYCTHMLTCAEASGKHTFGKGYVFLPNIFPPDNPLKSEGGLRLKEFPQDALKLAYIGGIEYKQKNAKFLIPVMKEVVKKCNAVLFIAGNGTCLKRLKKEIVKNNLEEHIVFLGYVQNTKKLLANVHFVIMPSYNEGMSMTLLEAQLAGVPCVVSKGIPKTNDIQVGLFYQMNTWNAKAWADSIKTLKEKQLVKTTKEEREKILYAIGYDSYTVANRLLEIYTL